MYIYVYHECGVVQNVLQITVLHVHIYWFISGRVLIFNVYMSIIILLVEKNEKDDFYIVCSSQWIDVIRRNCSKSI